MATDVFHRTAYAEQMAQQLLQPSPLHMNVRSGVLLSGIRRVGKTTFLRQDLVPALEARGALVVYVDLWADRSKSPATLVLDRRARHAAADADPWLGPAAALQGAEPGGCGPDPGLSD